RQASSVASGSGSPNASIATPPAGCSSAWTRKSDPREISSTTRRASAVTSRPIPSPGSHATRYVLALAIPLSFGLRRLLLVGPNPAHHAAQLLSNFLARMILRSIPAVEQVRRSTFTLGDPLPRKLAGPDFPEDIAHALLRRFIDDARTA